MRKITQILLTLICAFSIVLGVVACKGDEPTQDSNIAIVHFDLCTDIETTNVKDREVEKGSTLREPTVVVRGENPDNLEICGWYKEKEYKTQWNFDTDVVTGNMTLYAKWTSAHVITYYCKTQDYDPISGETPERTTATVRDGEFAQRRDVIADGYKILGYYEDENYTTEFDFNKPITEDTNIYIKTGDYLYYNAETIDRNFSIPTTTHSEGETQTGLSKQLITVDGKQYVDVCFGTRSEQNGVAIAGITAIANVKLDKSQHLVIKFKLPEGSTANLITIYPMVMNEDLEWSMGGTFRAYAWLDTMKDDYGNSLDMTKDEEGNYTWRIPFDKLSYNTDTYKVSTWATAVKLGQFRIDVRCKDHSTNDADPQEGWTFPETINNTIWFEEIYGEYCDEYINPQDEVDLASDSEEELVNKSNGQTAVDGWILPKDRQNASAGDGCTLYNTVDGSVLYVPYGKKTGAISLSGKNIEVDRLKVLKLVYKNHGGSDTLEIRMTVTNSLGEDKRTVVSVAMAKENADFVTYECNMADYTTFEGVLKSIEVVYRTNGVNNVVTLQQLSFEDYEPSSIAGVNFADSEFAGLTASGATLEFDMSDFSTKVNVTESGATLSGEYSYNTIAYATASLRVKSSGITKVTVSYVIGGETHSLDYNLGVITSWQTLSADLQEKGVITQISFAFEGVGVVNLKEFKFEVDVNKGIDFSDSFWAGRISSEKWNYTSPFGTTSVSYDVQKSATLLFGDETTGVLGNVRAYIGHVGKSLGNKFTNIVANKNSKIYIVYQNVSAKEKIHFKINTVDKTEANLYVPSDGIGYFFNETVIQSNMGEDEWAVLEINLSDKVSEEEDFLITYFTITTYSSNLYIRAIVVE